MEKCKKSLDKKVYTQILLIQPDVQLVFFYIFSYMFSSLITTSAFFLSSLGVFGGQRVFVKIDVVIGFMQRTSSSDFIPVTDLNLISYFVPGDNPTSV